MRKWSVRITFPVRRPVEYGWTWRGVVTGRL